MMDVIIIQKRYLSPTIKRIFRVTKKIIWLFFFVTLSTAFFMGMLYPEYIGVSLITVFPLMLLCN